MSRPARRFTVVALLALLLGTLAGAPAQAASYVPISGAGSTWSQNAIDQWRRNVNQFGMRVNYAGTGSSDGRNQFRNGTVDFAVSEIPYGLTDAGAVDTPPQRGYAYMPIVAGGTSFMYNLTIAGQRVTNLRLSGDTIADIFTGNVTTWDDPKVKADNPGLALPARKIVPVVRSDGSGTTAQFSTWLSKRHAGVWDGYCRRAGRNSSPCGVTSQYPTVTGSGFVAQSGSLGVSGYVAQTQAEGAITYVEYSYALNTGFPIAKMLNSGGYYVEPKASAVAVGLLGAKINTDKNSPTYLTQNLDGVYDNSDPRAYPLSSYSYMIAPTAVEGTFTTEKGKTLGDFAYYFLCEGQQQADSLGYSPLPVNLVKAGLDVVRQIPGVVAQDVDITKCNNPTFSPDGTNVLAKNATQPPACDRLGAAQCTTGTGGAKAATRTTAPPAAAPAAAGTSTGSAAGGPTMGGTAGAATAEGAQGRGAAGTVTGTAAALGGPSAVALDPSLVGDGTSGAAGGVSPVSVNAVPVALAQQRGWQLDNTLTLIAAGLLLTFVVAPPLLSRRLGARNPR